MKSEQNLKQAKRWKIGNWQYDIATQSWNGQMKPINYTSGT